MSDLARLARELAELAAQESKLDSLEILVHVRPVGVPPLEPPSDVDQVIRVCPHGGIDIPTRSYARPAPTPISPPEPVSPLRRDTGPPGETDEDLAMRVLAARRRGATIRITHDAAGNEIVLVDGREPT